MWSNEVMRHVAFAILLLMFGFSGEARASCAQFEITNELVHGRLLPEAGAVFVGTVVGSRDLELGPPEPSSGTRRIWTTHLVLYRFSVERWWKGDMASEEEVFTEIYRTSSGSVSTSVELRPVLGRTYLVYAFLSRPERDRLGGLELLTSSVCDAWEVDSPEAAAHMEVLGPGEPPMEP